MNIVDSGIVLEAAIRFNLNLPDDAHPNERIVVVLEGPPGLGKSQIMAQVASRIREDYPEFQIADPFLPVAHDPAEIAGYPYRDGDTQMRCRPDWLPSDGMGMLPVEEVGQAVFVQQAIITPLIYDWTIGQHRLGSKWTPVLATNRRQDKAGAGELITIIRNRVTTIVVEASLDAFSGIAMERGFDPSILAYIRWKAEQGEDALAEQAAVSDKAFRSPRSWEKTSQWLATNMPSHLMREAVAGTIGMATAQEFVAWRERIWGKMPTAKQIAADPESVDIRPDEPDLMFAISALLANTATVKTIDAYVTYLRRGGEVWLANFLSDIKRRGDARLMRTKAWTQWAIESQLDAA